MTGIICAMQDEVLGIAAAMTDKVVEYAGRTEFVRGSICGCDVVLCTCGVGKVFAAIAAQTMLLRYSPDEIINVGVAGALDPALSVYDVVLGRDVVQHDMDTSAIGDPRGLLSGINKIYLDTDKALTDAIASAASNAGIEPKFVRIATGDKFVDTDRDRDDIRRTFSASVCEMEGGAIAQACYMNGTPFALLRCISDSEEGDFAVFAKNACDISARVMLAYLENKSKAGTDK